MSYTHHRRLERVVQPRRGTTAHARASQRPSFDRDVEEEHTHEFLSIGEGMEGRNARSLYLWLLSFLVSRCHAFYLPGIHPVDWKVGESVPVRAAKLSSSTTHIPYDFYSVPYCEPKGGVKAFSQNLGEVGNPSDRGRGGPT